MTVGSVARAQKKRAKKLPAALEDLKARLASGFGELLTEADPGAWEYNLTYFVSRACAKEVFHRLKEQPEFDFQMLIDVTAVDWLDSREDRFEVVYQLLSLSHGLRIVLKIKVAETNPEVDSVCDLWSSANFLEREVWDMFGIKFSGHPDLRRVLMYDEFVGHPLRKDYPLAGKQPRIPLRIAEVRNYSVDLQRSELVTLPKRNS